MAGFVYSQTNDRLWRKNRQTQSGSSCVGRDINRNWPYQWDVSGGSDPNPCGQTYRGAAPGDSTEISGLIATLEDIQAQQSIKLYMDWHSYSELFMWRTFSSQLVLKCRRGHEQTCANNTRAYTFVQPMDSIATLSPATTLSSHGSHKAWLPRWPSLLVQSMSRGLSALPVSWLIILYPLSRTQWCFVSTKPVRCARK